MSAATVPQRLVLVGSVVVDVRLRVPRLPERGGDLLASSLSISAGGGMFVLAAAARGGLPTMYAGRHGAGAFGAVVRAALRAAGVEAAYAPDRAGDTGPCVVLVEPDGERTMVTANGVEAELDPQRLSQVDIRSDDAVYVSGYDLAYAVSGPAIAAWAPDLPTTTMLVCDPGPLVADLPDHVLEPVLARTDVLSLNTREAVLLAGSAEPAVVGRALLPRLAPDGLIVLRAGVHGATVVPTGAEPITVPVVPVPARDSTGAGDTHTGALVAARADGRPWAPAVGAANAAVAAFLERSERL